jgi:hypothetical protein
MKIISEKKTWRMGEVADYSKSIKESRATHSQLHMFTEKVSETKRE